MADNKPVVQILVEGELSPFEHETVYQLLRKRFAVEQPSYVELVDEDLATRVNLVFHHSYNSELFADVLGESWRELKRILKEIRRRRGQAGAAFSFTFTTSNGRLVFKSGSLGYDELSSAVEQVGYLTGMVHRMTRPDVMRNRLDVIECSFNPKADKWERFIGFNLSNSGMKYFFDESSFEWVPLKE